MPRNGVPSEAVPFPPVLKTPENPDGNQVLRKISERGSAKMNDSYELDELMVVEASRFISDGDIVLVGTGLPMVAGLFAQRNHAPNMCFVVETGPISPEVIPTPISVSDPRLMHRGEDRLAGRIPWWSRAARNRRRCVSRRRADRSIRERQLNGNRRL